MTGEKCKIMNIKVRNRENPENYRVYTDVEDVVDNLDGESFTIFTANHEVYKLTYKNYEWWELEHDEAIAHGIWSDENKNLKYKLTVNDSGYGLTCTKCERIIFIEPKIGDSVELDPKKLSELDWICVNGCKFRKEK